MRGHEVTVGSTQASTTNVAPIIDQRQDPLIKRMTFHLQREQPMSVLFTRVQRTNECVALACTYLSHVTGLTCVLPHNTPATLRMRVLEGVTITVAASPHVSRKRLVQTKGSPGGSGGSAEKKGKQAGASERPGSTTRPDAAFVSESPESDELDGHKQRNRGGPTARRVHHHRGLVPPAARRGACGRKISGRRNKAAARVRERLHKTHNCKAHAAGHQEKRITGGAAMRPRPRDLPSGASSVLHPG